MSGKLLAKHFATRHKAMDITKVGTPRDVYNLQRRKAAAKLKNFRKTHGSNSRHVMRKHLKSNFGKPMVAPLPAHLRSYTK